MGFIAKQLSLMSSNSKNGNDSLENTENPEKQPRVLHPVRYITIDISTFQYEQVIRLCKMGLSKNPTKFTREAVLDKIRENKHFIPEKMLAPKMKKGFNPSRNKRINTGQKNAEKKAQDYVSKKGES